MEQQRTIGQIIRDLRKKHNLTVEKFVEVIGLNVASSYISAIENDKKLPSPRVILGIENYFKLTPHTFDKLIKAQDRKNNKDINRYAKPSYDKYSIQ